MVKKAIILNDTRGYHLGCDLVNRNLTQLCKRVGIEILDIWGIGEHNQLIEKADLLIINGEGSFHHAAGSMKVSSIFERCQGKPTFLINTTWQDIDSPYKEEVGKFTIIAARESWSRRELEKITDGVTVVPDLSFWGDWEVETASTGGVGWTDSAIGEYSNLARQNDNFLSFRSQSTLADFISWAWNLELIVTGRFHGVCLAARMGKPFLAFPSNSHKIEGMLEDMGCQDLLVKSVGEIEDKKELAKKSTTKVKAYADWAKYKIERLFVKIDAEVS